MRPASDMGLSDVPVFCPLSQTIFKFQDNVFIQIRRCAMNVCYSPSYAKKKQKTSEQYLTSLGAC